MNKVIKRTLCGIVTIALILGLVPNMGEVKAVYATYYCSNVGIKYKTQYLNNCIYVYDSSGNYIDCIYIDGGQIDLNVFFTGNNAYFTWKDSENNASYIYCKNVITGNSQCMAKLPTQYFIWEVKDVYDGSVYLNAANPSDGRGCYRYYIKTKKLRKISSESYGERSNKYIICGNDRFSGAAYTSYKVYVYNSKKKKTSLVSKCSTGYSANGNMLYYSDCLNEKKAYINSYVIKSYDMRNGKRKVVVRSLKATGFNKITKENVFFYRYMGLDGVKYYRYHIPSKRVIEYTQEKYYELVR